MSREEILSLNGYLEDLYQAMQIGNIVFKANHSFELYNLIHKLLEENEKYKEVIDKAVEYIEKHLTDNGRFLMLNEWQVPDLLRILKEVEHE